MELKYKNLAKNTAIFAIGNFSTKILTFLIVPFYTYVLTIEEYGRIDLFTTTISFVIPIVTLTVQEALLRFLLGKEISEKIAVSNCWFIYIMGVLASILCFPVFRMYFKQNDITVFFEVLLAMNSFNAIFTHYLRAVEKNLVYTIKGIVETIILLLFNVIFLLYLKKGMMGYLYSIAISQAVGVAYLCFVGKLIRELSLKYVDKQILKKMLMFSIPLIPNSMMWWIMSAGNKYIINYFLGDSENGLYSLALKIPTIITMLYSLFFQAWQMSAIEENNSSDRKQFYEKIYNGTNGLLAVMVVGIILCIKPFYVGVMNERFAPAWFYVPFLSLGTAFNCQSSFFGVVYTTSKKTSKAFTTTALGAVVNILFNLLLIKPLGLQGVAIGTCLGYAVVCCIRANDAKKEIGIRLDIKRIAVTFIIIILQCLLTINYNNMAIGISGFVALVLVLLIFRKEIKPIIRILLTKKILKNKNHIM